MEEHQPIDINYQPIWDDDYIEDSMMQHYMEFMKIVETNQVLGSHFSSSKVW